MSWGRGEMRSAEVGRVEKRWQQVRRVETISEELRRGGQRRGLLRRVAKSVEEVKRAEVRWEGMKDFRAAKSWEVLVTVEKGTGKMRTNSQNRV